MGFPGDSIGISFHDYLNSATDISVTAGATTSGIDAVLAKVGFVYLPLIVDE